MDWPDESQWDETTCNMAVCQHPQCWAALRRIERGHPRILASPCKTLNIEEKPPVVTIVNISDSCFPAKRLVHQQLSEFTFTKAHSLLSQGSKVDARFQGRPQKCLPDRSPINSAKRSSKLPVLNLNKTKLPCPEDVRNMVVIWIPEPEKKESQYEKKKRKKLAVENKSPLDHSERQHTGVQSRSPDMIVPPSSPEHCFKPFTTGWTQVAMLPQDLLRDLLPDGGKNMLSQEMKIQLAMMKKNLPLEKNRPDSALSSKMFLTIHRLTLQQREGYRKQQQQKKKGKKPTKKQDTEKKPTGDSGSQTTLHKRSISINLNLLHGHRTWLGQKSDMKQQHMEVKGTTLKKDSIRRKMDDLKNYLNFLTSMGSPEIAEAGATDKDVSAPGEAVLEAPAASGGNLSGHMTGVSLDPEPKLLGILQSTDDEDEKKQPSGAEW
uniref:Chromosome 9 open reading frame 43 n=1 Tax=Sciurus vulgaris TaxID=55149 RepID=A0A8D2DKI5_SCIVU